MPKFLLNAVLIPGLILVATVAILGQPVSQYTPRRTYDQQSTELIKNLKAEFKKEAQLLQDGRLKSDYQKNLKFLLGMIKNEAFIHDFVLQNFVNRIVERILRENDIQHRPKFIFIAKNNSVNAYTVGLNCLVVNIGLLARVRSEDQLAFILAHEMAHNELGHVKESLTELREIKNESQGLLPQDVKNQNFANAVITLQRMAYDFSRFRRENEVEADSLGYLYYKKGGYPGWGALMALALMDSATYPKYPQGYLLLEPFHARDYPLQPQWLKGRPRGYAMQRSHVLLFQVDSLKSHPIIPQRMQFLANMMDLTELSPSVENDPGEIIRSAEFETIEAAYFMKKYDQCLHQALQQRSRYPKQPYLTTMIVKVLIELHQAKNEDTFYLLVQSNTANYGEELTELNHFLYNITPREMLEIAYHYLKNPKNFDGEVQEHHFLLWDLARLTDRKDHRKKLAKYYKIRFPNGKYVEKMH